MKSQAAFMRECTTQVLLWGFEGSVVRGGIFVWGLSFGIMEI